MDYGYGNGNGNQYSTSYGAQGAADGGGFVAGEAQSSQTGAKGGYGKDTVRPVTVKQLLDAQLPHPDADHRVDGDAISQVTFVGQIRSISTQTTNITYKVDDGTGIIEVKQWIDTEAAHDPMDVDHKSKLVEDSYCRVWGRLKSFNNKRHVGAHVLRTITDMNEVNYHLLEATAVHLFFTKGPPPTGQANGQRNAATNGADGGQQGISDDGLPRNTSMIARKVYKALKETSNSNEGLHVQMLASEMGTPVNEVYKGAEELLATGVIFTTVDDNTWAVLDA